MVFGQKFGRVFAICFSSVLLSAQMAGATTNITGLFEATKACQATRKLNTDNPGGVVLDVGEIYQLIAINSDKTSHFLIDIPNAPETTKRWVGVQCGQAALDDETITLTLAPIDGAARDKAVKTAEAKAAKKAGQLNNQKPIQGITPDSVENLLAASWLPTFCLSSAGSRAKECQNLRTSDVYAQQFSIHGLWPNDLDDQQIYPCYCHLNKPLKCNAKQKAFSSIDLPADLRNELKTKMPGIQSGFLHRHEWTKHGTCYEKYNTGEGKGSDEVEYYRDSVLVLDQLNQSKVGQLFRQNIGKVLSDDQIYAAFDRSFGKGASRKVFIECKRVGSQWMISELFIGLGGEITPDSKLADLIAASPSRDTYSNKRSCRRGMVVGVR